MSASPRSRVAIACQGGGSHTAFTAGVLQHLLVNLPPEVDVVALSGTSGGAMCATLAWDGLLQKRPPARGRPARPLLASHGRQRALGPGARTTRVQSLVHLRNHMVLPEVSPYAFPPYGQQKLAEIFNSQLDFEELRSLAGRARGPRPPDRRRRGPHRPLRGLRGPRPGASSACSPPPPSPTSSPPSPCPARASTGTASSPRTRPSTTSPTTTSTSSGSSRSTPAPAPRSPPRRTRSSTAATSWPATSRSNRKSASSRWSTACSPRASSSTPNTTRSTSAASRLSDDLDYASKLDRRPAFLSNLMAHGQAKARWFLKEREARMHTMVALGVLAENRA